MPDYYCIVDISTGGTRYAGKSLHTAAEHLILGTCHGAGKTKMEAHSGALRAARRLGGMQSVGGFRCRRCGCEVVRRTSEIGLCPECDKQVKALRRE